MRIASYLIGVALLLSLLAARASSAEPRVMTIWPDKAPGEKAPAKERVMPAKAGEKPPTTRITDVGMPTLTIYPPRVEKNQVMVIICPGGGYNYLTFDKEGSEVAAWLNELGIWAAVLKYRVPSRAGDTDPPHLAPLQDAQRVIRFLRNERRWPKVGIMGFSAGGNLAVAAATRFEKPAYEKIDDVDTLTCRPDFAIPIYPAYLTAKGSTKLLDTYPVSKDTPPCFLVHAFNDGVPAENSVAFYTALQKAGVPAELHIYAAGGHGFGIRPSPHPIAQWPQRCEDWLRQQGWVPMK